MARRGAGGFVVVGPLGSSPTRSQTFQLVIAACRLLSRRRWLAPEPVSPSLFQGSLLPRLILSLVLHLSPTPACSLSLSLSFLSNSPALCSSALPFPSHDSLHRDAAVAADADAAAVARVAPPLPASPPPRPSPSRAATTAR